MRLQIMLIVILACCLFWVAGIRTAMAVAHHQHDLIIAYGHLGHKVLRNLI